MRGSDVLTVLDLSENAIGDSGAAALAASLAAAGAQNSSRLVRQQCAQRQLAIV